MSYFLCIDSSTDHASVALAKDEQLLALNTCENQKEHAGFFQPAIEKITQEQGITLSQLKAITVTSGPGSYTGLRVSMATAKGLCYALNLPLITIPTTLVMAFAARQQINQSELIKKNYYLRPMIDARRMEVFTALYDDQLQELQQPQALILSTESLMQTDSEPPVYFFGNGAKKINLLPMQPTGKIIPLAWNGSDMIAIAHKKITAQQYSSIAYATPDYIKNFHEVTH
jgi:tRNA threonylcarbamoyladenosine biosynthesis protein TsaB